MGMTYVVVAAGLTLVFGVMRIFNFAHGELYMLGGFIAYLFMDWIGMHFFFAMIVTILVMFVLGVLIEKLLFRPLRGELTNSMILSLGLSMGLSGGALLVFGEQDFSIASPFPGIIHIGGTIIAVERLMVIFLCFIIMAAMFFFLKKSKWGQAMRAVAADEEAAELQGMNINQISSLSFGISSALAGAAGVMILPLFKINASMGIAAVINSVVVIVLGGMGSIPGCVVGGLFLGFVNTFSITYIGGTIGGLLGFIMIMIMIIVRPRGLMGNA